MYSGCMQGEDDEHKQFDARIAAVCLGFCCVAASLADTVLAGAALMTMVLQTPAPEALYPQVVKGLL